MENTWNLIPQVFYDFIARIVPGAFLILVTALVIFSPAVVADFILNSPGYDRLFSTGIFLLWSQPHLSGTSCTPSASQ